MSNRYFVLTVLSLAMALPGTAIAKRNKDTVPPTATLSVQERVAVGERFRVIVQFDERVRNFVATDVVLANAQLATLEKRKRSRWIAVIDPTGGDVTVEVPHGVATDRAGNGNIGDRISDQSLIFLESGPGEPNNPNEPTDPEDPTDPTAPQLELRTFNRVEAGERFSFIADFGEPVNGFNQSDVTVTNGEVSRFDEFGDDAWVISVQPVGSTVTVVIDAGVAVDADGNTNTSAQLGESDVFLTAGNIFIPYADATAGESCAAPLQRRGLDAVSTSAFIVLDEGALRCQLNSGAVMDITMPSQGSFSMQNGSGSGGIYYSFFRNGSFVEDEQTEAGSGYGYGSAERIRMQKTGSGSIILEELFFD